MTDELCSIIIPFYSGVPFLENAIRSILATAYKNIEILVIDDGTSPWDIPSHYWEYIQLIDSRIQIFHKNHSGIADTRNYGVEQAKGKYITFFDQDDLMEGDMYSEMIRIQYSEDADFVCSNVYCTDKNRKYIADTIKKDVVLIGDEIQELRKWLVIGEVIEYSGEKIRSTIWNCLFLRKLITENQLMFESNVAYDDDWNFLVKYLAVCKRAYLTPKAFYIWNIWDGSESHKRVYLKNLPDKLKKHYQFKKRSIKSLTVTPEELLCFESYYRSDCLYRILQNESVKVEDFSSLLIARNMIIEFLKRENASYSSYGYGRLKVIKGKRAGIAYWLASHKMVCLALLAARMK